DENMSLWGQLFEKPVFVLTSDQDWTPPWAAASLVELVRQYKVPVHFFRTNPCPIIDAAAKADKYSQGWHPNFLPGSSHGSDYDDVVKYLSTHFPGARTSRSHVYVESSVICQKLADAGVIADSQLCTFFQGELQPMLHSSGIVRFPTFFEDD